MASIFGSMGAGPTAGTSMYDLGLPLIKLGFDTKPNNRSGGSLASSGARDAEVLGAFIDEMYEQFRSEELSYDARTAEEISAEISAWLRPGYDQAIANRRSQTLAYQAQTDADAIARGMGASTYVTDVKARQVRDESRDVATLESDYGSALAKYVSDGVASDNQRALETQMFNIQQRQSAYELAYSAALKLFETYQKSAGSRRSSAKSSSKITATTAENCDLFLSLLTPQERKEVYEAATPEGARYREEILASVGYAGYINLRGKYRESP